MANKPANAAQKKWMSDIAEWAVENIAKLYGHEWSGTQFQLHHVYGRAAKHNKVAIGHWDILPVPFDLHDVSSNNNLNVTHNKKKFTATFGSQSYLFDVMVTDMQWLGYDLPPEEVLKSISETSA